jgi:hypothetical protein
MVGLIAERTKNCRSCFSQLSSLLSDNKKRELPGISKEQIDDEQDRFMIWAGNAGATQGVLSSSSLDHRLREAPRLSLQFAELLDDLRDALESGLFLIMSRGFGVVSSHISLQHRRSHLVRERIKRQGQGIPTVRLDTTKTRANLSLRYRN